MNLYGGGCDDGYGSGGGSGGGYGSGDGGDGGYGGGDIVMLDDAGEVAPAQRPQAQRHVAPRCAGSSASAAPAGAHPLTGCVERTRVSGETGT
jgi:hypothetical protein